MPVSSQKNHVIAVRSLTNSDLGLFDAHRARATSNQRAININAGIAQAILSPDIYLSGGQEMNCVCMFGGEVHTAMRWLGKSNKNWRLGGPKIQGNVFSRLDSKDFVLIRSVRHNDGSTPLVLAFISRNVDRVVHAGIAAIVKDTLKYSVVVFNRNDPQFDALVAHCPMPENGPPRRKSSRELPARLEPPPILPMPRDDVPTATRRRRTIREKLQEPHIMERMLRASADLSAPAQLRFIQTVEGLASQLRSVLEESDGIVRLKRDHSAFWHRIRGSRIGFVDGGLANLSMFGSAPIAARVGGYSVVPGDTSTQRETFIVLKHLIDELYMGNDGGVYDDAFPDIGALRDAARISVEASGAIQLISDFPDHDWVFTHGALVNPVSRYSDVMQDGEVRFRFPNFSSNALKTLLPIGDPPRTDRQRNFIPVHLRQLELLKGASSVVCGVMERESTTTLVCHTLLNELDGALIADCLEVSPAEWKREFRRAIDPAGDDEYEGQRIADPLLFRCVLEPGEVLRPVALERNEIRRAPAQWKQLVSRYPKPHASYLQVSEWSAPIRLEMFESDLDVFEETANLLYHCALLLPQYAFPVGLDIVDKFARIPNWMSRPVNTRTAVLALKHALNEQDAGVFDALRHMLCGSGREFYLRPSVQ